MFHVRVAPSAIAVGRSVARSAIACPHRAGKDVDARDKPGHDAQ